MKLGITQGRLLPPVNNFIQEYPFKDWDKEFNLIKQIGLNHIEWIITKNSLDSNAFYKLDLKKFPIHSVCFDVIVDERFTFDVEIQKQLRIVSELAIMNGVRYVTIPLLEGSSVCNKEIRKTFIQRYKNIFYEFSDINFSIEAEASIDELSEILDISDNIFVTYDTGNITSFSNNHEDYINAFYDRINNVHLKDRTLDARTVKPGTGSTPFEFIFQLLKKRCYNGVFTMQSARGETGEEINTISDYKVFFENLYYAR